MRWRSISGSPQMTLACQSMRTFSTSSFRKLGEDGKNMKSTRGTPKRTVNQRLPRLMGCPDGCKVTYEVSVSIVALSSCVVAACPCCPLPRGVAPAAREGTPSLRLSGSCCLLGDIGNGDEPLTQVTTHGGCRGYTLLALTNLISSAAPKCRFRHAALLLRIHMCAWLLMQIAP